MADNFGWLIERSDGTQYAKSPPEYLTFNSSGCIGAWCWSGLHDQALRFSRRQDATQFVTAAIMASKNLPLGETLEGLRACDPHPMIVEHCWIDPSQDKGEA